MEFSVRAHKMLAMTTKCALNLGHDHISSEHFLLGAVMLGEGVGSQILSNTGLSSGQLHTYLADCGPTAESSADSYGDSGRQVLEAAIRYANSFRRSQVESGDMILALLDETAGGAAKALAHFGVDRAATRQLLFDKMS